MSGNEFLLRETDAGDIPGLNSLYRRVSGIQRNEAQWHWEWRAGPWGTAPSWVIIEKASGVIVGHHGVVPQRLRLPDGRILAACRTENTMVDPDYRKRFMYVAYEARLLKTVLEQFDLVMTTAGKGPQALLRKRLGYHAVGNWRTAPLHAHWLYPAAVFVPAPVLAWLPARLRDKDWQIDETRDVSRIAASCRRAQGKAITVERGEAFLRWRFLDHPYHRYHLAILRQADNDAGYIAWKRTARGGAIDLVVEDMLIVTGQADDYRKALQAFALAQPGPVRVVLRVLDSGGPLSRVMAEAAPASMTSPNSTELLVRWREEPLASDWDVTPALSQGI